MRHWRMTTKKDIKVRPIQAYVKEAIGLVEAGASIKPDKNRAIDVPPELEAALKKSAPLRKAFDALTPGKRRDYAQHIGDAKREETKAKRLEKILPMIRAGVGLHDKYRNC